MKTLGRLALITLFLAVATIGQATVLTIKNATGTSSYDFGATTSYRLSGPLLGFIDANGDYQIISASNPVPINAAITIGSVSVTVGAPPDIGSTTTATSNSTSASVTALANRLDVSIYNIATETLWVNIGGAVATVGQGIPVYSGGYISRELDYSVPISYVSSTPTSIVIHQAGY